MAQFRDRKAAHDSGSASFYHTAPERHPEPHYSLDVLLGTGTYIWPLSPGFPLPSRNATVRFLDELS